MTTHHDRREDRPSIDDLLGEEGVLAHEYDNYDFDAEERAIAAALYGTPTTAGAAADADPNPPALRERAGHELSLAAAVVLNADQATDALERLSTLTDGAPDGALVFACLLYLAHHEDGARFWWQVAAGCGNRTAAHCLYLLHRSHGQTRDADHWRGQAERPTATRLPHVNRGEPRPLLTDRVRHALIAASHSGADPRLPPAVEQVIHDLPVDAAAHDFGEVPVPEPTLAQELAVATTP
ncbi:hypothetical protein OG948_50390 (plasmid) [Embleya sp. NBC_00888]|uniref:hypothetical protein n=1 Tax=Embleya sp. NBC_00888 TaxID=2975960 RepID=UPI002F91AA72|nr:hypothetical protein OG948_50390 [Embleya sp. NBC_00888]